MLDAGAFHKAPEHGRGVRYGHAGDEGEGNGGGDAHAGLLVSAQLGYQRVKGRAVHGHEQIEAGEHKEQENGIYPAAAGHRRPESKYGEDAEGDRRGLHEGDAAALGILAAVGQGGDPWVGDRVEYAPEAGYQRQYAYQAENDGTGLKKRVFGKTGGFVWHIEVYEIVADQGA